MGRVFLWKSNLSFLNASIVETSKKLKVRGLGLGLSYSRMIARAHGGDLLLIESSKDGSTFCLTLPKTT